MAKKATTKTKKGHGRSLEVVARVTVKVTSLTGFSTTDDYSVVMSLGRQRVQTDTKKGPNPTMDEQFVFDVTASSPPLEVSETGCTGQRGSSSVMGRESCSERASNFNENGNGFTRLNGGVSSHDHRTILTTLHVIHTYISMIHIYIYIYMYICNTCTPHIWTHT